MLTIPKKRERFVSEPFLNYIRSLPCVVCGAVSTPSHMISAKRAEGSDALAVPACIVNGHHVQSTRTSREILEHAGIDIHKLHRNLWFDFAIAKSIAIGMQFVITADFKRAQKFFEEFLISENLGTRGAEKRVLSKRNTSTRKKLADGPRYVRPW